VNLRIRYGNTEISVLKILKKVLTKWKMCVIIKVEDRSLIVQAEAGQRVKKTAAIGMGLHLLHRLLLPLIIKRAVEYMLLRLVLKGNTAHFLYL
jgi:hypothetical protein